MNKRGKIITIIIIGLLVFTGIGVLIGREFHTVIPDDNTIVIPSHTPTNGETTPTYYKPEILLGSAIITPDYDSADFQICISNPEYVVNLGIHFYVDGVESTYAFLLDNPISGIYETTIYMNQFANHEPNSVIIIFLLMAYIDEQNAVAVEREDDVIEFSFLIHDSEPDPPPTYFPPEFVPGTFEFSIEKTIITFGFTMTYQELVNNIGCYFVIDGTSVKTATGSVYTIETVHVDSGYFQSSFDYTKFPFDVDVYLFLDVSYVNEDGETDSFTVEELSYFNVPSGTANGAGINYIMVIVALVATLTSLTVYKKQKVKNK